MSVLSANARRVLEARYLERDAAGRPVEDFEGLCRRVAVAVAEAESVFGGDVARTSELLPGSAPRARVPSQQPHADERRQARSGSSLPVLCLPIEDTLESIFEALKRMAVIHQSGGGTGFSFSQLRPGGDAVKTSPGVASGPVSFLGVFDAATSVIKQGGRRRGANMGVMRVDHPDVLEFVRAKQTEGRIANFNLSVATTDAFWHAALAGQSFDLVNPRNGKVARSIDAAALLAEIAQAAWASGDPGVIFLDAVNRANPTPALGALEATNPCGELPLLANESCTLGSLRLDAFVARAGRSTGKDSMPPSTSACASSTT